MYLLNAGLTALFALLCALFPITGIAKDKAELPVMHHLVDIKPSDAVSIPESFPLNKDGLITCKTCHAIKDIGNIPHEDINKNDKSFFREGPYTNFSNFCYRCHDKTTYPRLNVHKLLDEKGKIIKSQCLYCHEKTLDPEKTIAFQDIKFKTDIEKLCYGCHLDTPHLNAINHHKKPEKEMLERIKQYEQENNMIFPLDRQGRIMCSTCHNPHQQGVIADDKTASQQVANADLDTGISYYEKDHWEAVYQADKQARLSELNKNLETTATIQVHYKRIKTEVLLRLPAKDGSLCKVCHKFES